MMFLTTRVGRFCFALVLAGSGFTSAEEKLPTQVYFGETHVHTAYSLDAYLGGTRLTPADAYRHARGEAVIVNGKPHRLRRPLDFAAVTDHAEYLGEMYAAMHPGTPGHDSEEIQQLIRLEEPAQRREWFLRYVIKNTRSGKPQHLPFYPGEHAVRNGWQVLVDAAEQAYIPGEFTTFAAFEWSSAPLGANLHRNILFRSNAVPELPVSSFELPREEALWRWLDTQAEKGRRAMAIPHNANASKGLMFPAAQSDGGALNREYAQLRERHERLIEIMQVKGNSEVHPRFWAADEFADFEIAPSIEKFSGRTFQHQNFVRGGLEAGLAFKAELGVNPFKLGFTGGTDSHNGVMGDTDEAAWAGGHGLEDSSPRRRQSAEVGGWLAARDQSPGSLAAVWAIENRREVLWDAMYRREAYATSGTRIVLRFFGGWSLSDELTSDANMVAQAYRQGVPMGSDLPAAKGADAPRFLVSALRDPLGANLDRVQIVKGWVDAKGKHRDKVFDVVWSGARQPNAQGQLPAVGNTVDLTTATYRNTIGADALATVWQDPEFDPAVPAFYYVRVLEIPTPRWTTFDAVRAELPLPADVPAVVQERAWSSPIWYQPH